LCMDDIPAEESGPMFHRMMAALRKYWALDRGMYLLVAPAVCEGEAGPDATAVDGYRAVDISIGWASARLDLSSPLEVLRQGMRQKWRNGLNKAERLGISAESRSASGFDEVLAQYDAMLRDRDYHTSITVPMLTAMQEMLPLDRQFWSLVGVHGAQRFGGILLAQYGATCEYLVSAITDAGKAASVGNLLLWQAVIEAKTRGCRWFDLGGLDRHRTPPGILHFKAGVGGTPYRLVKELETHDGGWRARIVWSRVRKAHF
jgi:hypothetical protein